MRTIVLASCLIAVACTVRVADLTLVSTKNIDLNRARIDVRQGQRFRGEDCAFLFSLPNLESAIDDALEKGRGDVMVDQVTYQRVRFLTQCIEVEGTVLNTGGAPGETR